MLSLASRTVLLFASDEPVYSLPHLAFLVLAEKESRRLRIVRCITGSHCLTRMAVDVVVVVL